MATKDFLPSRDPELLAWSHSFIGTLTPIAVSVGCTAIQCAAYQTAHDLFASKLGISSEPSTRTRSAIEDKNLARTPLKQMARDLARIINAFPATTNVQRIDLGLNPRTGEISPINPPTEPPILEVVGAIGRTLKVKVHAIDSNRSKPEGVDGCSVFSFTGSAPPADITQWVFQGSTSRNSFTVEFSPTTPAGSQVFLCAFWFSPRKQSGPACQPVSAYIAGGVVTQQQAA